MTKATPKLQVLVVDDSPVYRKIVEHTLEDGGYAPLFAKTEQEAMDLYAQHALAIVITDWLMPDFLRTGAVRANPRGCAAPIYLHHRADEHLGEGQRREGIGGRRG
jgi:CheY-like chemotaxis protein